MKCSHYFCPVLQNKSTDDEFWYLTSLPSFSNLLLKLQELLQKLDLKKKVTNVTLMSLDEKDTVAEGKTARNFSVPKFFI